MALSLNLTDTNVMLVDADKIMSYAQAWPRQEGWWKYPKVVEVVERHWGMLVDRFIVQWCNIGHDGVTLVILGALPGKNVHMADEVHFCALSPSTFQRNVCVRARKQAASGHHYQPTLPIESLSESIDKAIETGDVYTNVQFVDQIRDMRVTKGSITYIEAVSGSGKSHLVKHHIPEHAREVEETVNEMIDEDASLMIRVARGVAYCNNLLDEVGAQRRATV
jgi:hypothetical protein